MLALAEMQDRGALFFVRTREFPLLMQTHDLLGQCSALTINHTFPRDRDVHLMMRKDQAMKIDFPIMSAISATQNDRIPLQVQGDMTAQSEGAGEKTSGGNDNSTASRRTGRIHGLLHGIGIESHAIAFGAVGGDGKISLPPRHRCGPCADQQECEQDSEHEGVNHRASTTWPSSNFIVDDAKKGTSESFFSSGLSHDSLGAR